MSDVRRLGVSFVPWTQQRVAIVFADLSDFVTFTATHGDQAAAELLALNRLTLAPIVDALGGRVAKHLGDGVLLVFDDPTPAICAAVEIVNATSDVLQMRAGVHWGHAIAVGTDLVGNDVNLASRVVATAGPGEVLVTWAARRAARSLNGIRYGPLGSHPAKGLAARLLVSTARRDRGEHQPKLRAASPIDPSRSNWSRRRQAAGDTR